MSATTLGLGTGPLARVHGGSDAQGPARWDFSTCSNAAGPCPAALAAVHAADLSRYPDPAGTRVRQALAALHGVAPARVLLAASASEFIQRITAVTGRLWPGPVALPRHAYGDYRLAAQAWGRTVQPDGDGQPLPATLRWFADPGSPLGQAGPLPDGGLADLGRQPAVLDAVYAPLRLRGATAWGASARAAVFVLHSPNKALGLTGLRGAYAIAPEAGAVAYPLDALCEALAQAAPSWPLSAAAEALLLSWATPVVQHWVRASHPVLAAWLATLQRRLAARGFELQASDTPFFVARPPRRMAAVTPAGLRRLGVAVRPTDSFGLPGGWRLSAQSPAAQDALMQALDTLVQQAVEQQA